mmetsp:Transcript_68262/g.134920  ORF Transcript_68262/g.134920 Transcript_68262/m.134920 type:complete len:336 (-) Transcript_68262:84-1091(-)
MLQDQCRLQPASALRAPGSPKSITRVRFSEAAVSENRSDGGWNRLQKIPGPYEELTENELRNLAHKLVTHAAMLEGEIGSLFKRIVHQQKFVDKQSHRIEILRNQELNRPRLLTQRAWNPPSPTGPEPWAVTLPRGLAPPPMDGGVKPQPQPLTGRVRIPSSSGRPCSRLRSIGRLHLTVITSEGARMPLEVGGEDTPAAVLHWLCGAPGSPKSLSGLPLAASIEGMRLLHCGQPLDPGTSFLALGISDKSTVRLLPAVATARNWGHAKPLPDAPRGLLMTSRTFAQESIMGSARPHTGASGGRDSDVREFRSQVEQCKPQGHLPRSRSKPLPDA